MNQDFYRINNIYKPINLEQEVGNIFINILFHLVLSCFILFHFDVRVTCLQENILQKYEIKIFVLII